MRASMLLLLAALLIPGRAAVAQAADAPSAAPVRAAPLHALQLGTDALPGAPYDAPPPRRDRVTGALLGMGIGALVGGVGFATMHHVGSDPDSTKYTGLSLMLGGMVGGAAGLVVGAIVGVPGRSARSEDPVRLRVSPGLPQGRAAASLSVDLAL